MRAKRKYGCRPSKPHMANRQFKALKPVPLPSSFDPRSQHPAAYDQEEEGCCTGNTWARMVQFDWIKQGVANAMTLMPARNFIYFNERALELTTAIDAGAEIHDGGRALVQWGVPLETLWPYIEDQFALKPPPDVYAQAAKNAADSWSEVPQDERQIKTALYHGFPVGHGIWAYESLETDEVARTGHIVLPKSGEQMIGGHALTLVGWEDSVQAYIGFNSWGVDWGMTGTYLIPFDYIHNQKLAGDFCILDRMKLAA